MVSTPNIKEGKFYIRGFSNQRDYEKYEGLESVIVENIKDRESKGFDLVELQEEITEKENKKTKGEGDILLAKNKGIAMQNNYDNLKRELIELKQKLTLNAKKEFSSQALKTGIKSIDDYAKKSKSKWKSKVEHLSKEIEKLNALNNSEQEKLNSTFTIINRTVKEIRGHFFTGRRDATANALQDIIDDSQPAKSFDALKSLLQTINQDAIINKSKWRNKTKTLLGKIERIDNAGKTDREKLTAALDLINHAAKDIRGHFFGGKGSTIATRLEKIVEKKDSYLAHASEQDQLQRELLQKTSILKKLQTDPAVKSLKKEIQQGKESLAAVDKEVQLLKQKERSMEKEIKELDKKITDTESKRLSFTVQIACTDNVRGYLDSHPECNFTQPIKAKQLKIYEASRKVGIFQPVSRKDIAATQDDDEKVPKNRGRGL